MLKDMAVIHEGMLTSRRLIEGDEELHLSLDEHSVLPTGEMSWRWRPLIDKMRNNAPWIWNGCAIPTETTSQTSVVPSWLSTSMRSKSKGFPFIPMRRGIFACSPSVERFAHRPLLRTN
jgi:hypothetical protein